VYPDLLDTFSRARQAYASVSESLSRDPGGEKAAVVASEESPRQLADVCAVEGFERSAERFCALLGWVASEQARGLEHSRLEARLADDGRELIRVILQDHLHVRAGAEQRVDGVVGSDGVPRRNVERAHGRELLSVFGEVEVGRLGYRARGSENLYPADALLNLPAEKHSHAIRRLAALEAPRTSFETLKRRSFARAASGSATASSESWRWRLPVTSRRSMNSESARLKEPTMCWCSPVMRTGW
jgi:hypothetical protein